MTRAVQLSTTFLPSSQAYIRGRNLSCGSSKKAIEKKIKAKPFTLHAILAGKMTCDATSQSMQSTSCTPTYKCIAYCHRLLRCLWRHLDVEISYDGSQAHPHHDLREMLACADARTEAKGEELCVHIGGVVF